MKVIINADDLGISLEVNKAIETAIINGKISSTTILANGPAFDDAIRIVKHYPQVSFGVHLNLVEFMPLTNSEAFYKYNIIDADGLFRDGAIFVIDKFDVELKTAVYNEWSMQVEKILKAGVLVSHIDSHQHTHGIFALQDVLIKLLKSYNITKVRKRAYMPIYIMMLSRDKHDEEPLDKSRAVQRKKSSFVIRRIRHIQMIVKHYIWIRKMKKNAQLTSEFFAYSTFTYCFNTYFKYKHIATVELMCHPGHFNYANEAKSVYIDKLSELTYYELISYNEL